MRSDSGVCGNSDWAQRAQVFVNEQALFIAYLGKIHDIASVYGRGDLRDSKVRNSRFVASLRMRYTVMFGSSGNVVTINDRTGFEVRWLSKL